MIFLTPGALQASDPVEFWLKGNLKAKASEHVRVTVTGTTKVDDTGHGFYEAKDLGVIYTGITHWLDVGAYYKAVFRQIDIPEQEDVWQHEQRPHLNATARFELLGLTFSDRVQIEYNKLEDLGDYQTFRNRISINPPIYLDPLRERRVLKDKMFRPFASYEIFLTGSDGVSKHRLEGGASIQLSKRVFFDLYYMRQEHSSTDAGQNIAGLTLKLLF